MCIIDFPILFTSERKTNNTLYMCHTFSSGSLINSIYSVFLACVYSVIPCGVISVLNALILKKISSKRKFRVNHQTSQQGKPIGMVTSLTITMFSVCIVFAVTTLPGRIMIIVHTIAQYLGMDVVLYEIYLVVAFRVTAINHCVNFLLYCISGSVFRQTFVRLFKNCKVRQPSRPIEEPVPTVESQL